MDIIKSMNNETLFQKSLRLNPRAYRQKSNKQKPINLDIYEEAIKNYPNVQHRQRHLNHMFRKIMRRMRRYVVCQELDIKKNAISLHVVCFGFGDYRQIADRQNFWRYRIG